eukprot:2726241-Pyramimonas_sp.AAC.1
MRAPATTASDLENVIQLEAGAHFVRTPSDLYRGGLCQETPCLPPGCAGFLGLRWFCDGERN